MINPPNKHGAYVDGHQRTHKAEPLAQWESEEYDSLTKVGC